MSLDALLEPLPDRNAPKLCKVGSIIDSLQDPYKSALHNLLIVSYDDGGASDEAIADRMKTAGLPVGARTIYQHRKKRCACPEQVAA